MYSLLVRFSVVISHLILAFYRLNSVSGCIRALLKVLIQKSVVDGKAGNPCAYSEQLVHFYLSREYKADYKLDL